MHAYSGTQGYLAYASQRSPASPYGRSEPRRRRRSRCRCHRRLERSVYLPRRGGDEGSNHRGGGGGEAQACVDYLRNKSSKACTVSGDVVFCNSGTTKIYDSNTNLVNNPSSSCSDVVFDGCTQRGMVAGSHAANGNGDVVVSINHQTGTRYDDNSSNNLTLVVKS
ncbi:hypothetical protein BDW66DRAFT_148097 [Aspergillus desertorum]